MDQNTSKVFAESPAMAPSNPVAPNGMGSPLFVINLCASMAPIPLAAKTLPGLDSYRLYQVSRAEDGRTRYRLRLGFFTSESDAEQTLAAVRDRYPTAFTACLADEDRKFARGFIPDASQTTGAHNVINPRAQMSVVVDNDSTRPVKALRIAPVAPMVTAKPVVAVAVKVIAAPVPATAPPAPEASSMPVIASESPVIEIDWEPAPISSATTTSSASTVATAPAPDAIEIEMTWEPSVKLAEVNPASAPATPATPVAPVAASAPITAKAVSSSAAAPTSTAPKVTSSAVPIVQQPAVSKSESGSLSIDSPAAKLDTPPVTALSTSAAAIAPAITRALELATTTQPFTTASTPLHRGVIEARAPALDSIELSLDVSHFKPAAVAVTSNQPFHVGKGIALPLTDLTLDTDVSGATRATTDSRTTPAAANSVNRTQPPLSRAAPVPATTTARQALSQADLDSTQTIRALTAEELNDESQEKCFAIQLAVSEQPVNLDAMPHLDIFEAYRLYSIATAGSGKITHSLRIGFFREEVSAEAVSGYLRTFFPSPTIVRISLAEQARFKEPSTGELATVASVATEQNGGNVVALNEMRNRNAKPVIPVVTMEVTNPARDASATGSFKPNATGSFKPNATGSFKSSSTGTFKPGSTGAHKAMKPAAQSAATPTKQSPPVSNKLATGRHKALPSKSLSQQLREEAREVVLSESGIMKLPKSGSLLSRLVGKLSK